MKYLVIRTCFRDACLYKAGEVREISEEMAQKHPKDFQLVGQPPVPSDVPESKSVEGAIVCPTCGRKFSHKIALSGHLRTHKDKS